MGDKEKFTVFSIFDYLKDVPSCHEYIKEQEEYIKELEEELTLWRKKNEANG